MRLRSLSFAVVLSTCSVIAAFVASASASAATPTPSVMVTPTPLPDVVVLEASFVSGNGREIWICIASQFDGRIENIAVRTDLDEGCDLVALGLGLQSGADVPHRHLVRLEDPALTCDSGPHDWSIDYFEDACAGAGCVREVTASEFAAHPFGAGCSTGAVFPLTAILSARIGTTGALRFRVGAEQTFASVRIETLRIYDKADDLMTDCTASPVITGGGTGLFDTVCTPNAAPLLIPGTDYYAMIAGEADGGDYIGYMAFTFEEPL